MSHGENQRKADRRGNDVYHALHLDLAIELLKLLLTEKERDVRKTITGFFAKLSLPEDGQADTWKTKAVYQLIQSVKEVSLISFTFLHPV